MRSTPTLTVMMLAATLLAGCVQQHPLPKPAAPAVDLARPPPAAHIKPKPRLRTYTLDWVGFDQDRCQAQASDGEVGLAVLIGDRETQLQLHLADRSKQHFRKLHLDFSGPAGHWQRQGSATAGGLRAVVGSDEIAMGDILLLMNGGTLQIKDDKHRWPRFVVRAAGRPGRVWFQCIRRRLFP